MRSTSGDSTLPMGNTSYIAGPYNGHRGQCLTRRKRPSAAPGCVMVSPQRRGPGGTQRAGSGRGLGCEQGQPEPVGQESGGQLAFDAVAEAVAKWGEGGSPPDLLRADGCADQAEYERLRDAHDGEPVIGITNRVVAAAAPGCADAEQVGRHAGQGRIDPRKRLAPERAGTASARVVGVASIPVLRRG
jgi:hypothetical protein